MDNFNNQNGYQPNNQNQYGYQQPNQQQYGNQQYNQGQYNGQQLNQGQYGYQQFNQNQNQMQYSDQSYQAMQYVDQPISQPVKQEAVKKSSDPSGPKKKKTGLIIGLIVALAVLLIGAGVTAAYFYLNIKKDKEAASTTASEFIKAYGYHDLNNLQSHFPEQMKKSDAVVDLLDEEKYDGVKYYGYTIKDVEVTDVQKYSVDSVIDEVADEYNKHLDVKASYWVSVKYTETYDRKGETIENAVTDNVICGKIDEQWYVLDPALISKKNQIVADFDKEADDDQSKDVMDKFMTCVTESDLDGMNGCFAADVRDSDTTKEGIEALTTSFDKMEEFDITYTVSDATVTDAEEIDISEAKESVKKSSGIDPSFDRCRKFNADYSVTIEADGESETKDVSEEFICGKEDGKWYVYSSKIITDHNDLFVDIIDEKETARDVEEVRATTETFLQSLALLDIDTMKSLMPDEILEDEEVAESISKLESQRDEFNSYGVVLTVSEMQFSEIKEENTAALLIGILLGYGGMSLDVEKAYSTSVTFDRTWEFRGHSETDSFNVDITCGKIDGKWYILQAEIPDDE